MDAVEARVTKHDDELDRFASKVGDAQTTAGLVLARLDTLDRIDRAVRLTREDHAATRAKVTILMAVTAAVGVAVLGVLAKLVAG